ncbi:Hypothetical protein AT6N2_L1298 [Agrobacterium tumefaciens]|nr:Hypothetical protein AT6N2_L1298 [Agrobacterium tumefaciens]
MMASIGPGIRPPSRYTPTAIKDERWRHRTHRRQKRCTCGPNQVSDKPYFADGPAMTDFALMRAAFL